MTHWSPTSHPHTCAARPTDCVNPLDTVGAFAGPLLAMGLMLAWSNDFRAVFWVALAPGLLSVVTLLVGVREPERPVGTRRGSPIHSREIARLSSAYWWVVALGSVVTLARFSEAFLVLHAHENGVPLAWVPLVFVLMNVVYALSAYPAGRLADRWSHSKLLALGLAVLIAADVVLAFGRSWPALAVGVALWGLHMGLTQGLLATMVADTAPVELRGTAFGIFSLVGGLAMLLASIGAGWLWERLGSSYAFGGGALLCLLGLTWIAFRRQNR